MGCRQDVPALTLWFVSPRAALSWRFRTGVARGLEEAFVLSGRRLRERRRRRGPLPGCVRRARLPTAPQGKPRLIAERDAEAFCRRAAGAEETLSVELPET